MPQPVPIEPILKDVRYMAALRWKLSDLLLLVLLCGFVFALYRFFWWPPPDTNARSYLAAYLALLTTTSLGSFFARKRWRRPLQGYALYAWSHLIFILWGGGEFTTKLTNMGGWTVTGCWMGFAFGVLCAIVAGCLFEPPSEGQRPS